MAADSLYSDLDLQPLPTPACKIGIVGNAVFVGTGFDVSWAARQALQSVGSLKSRLQLFDTLARPVLQATFRKVIAENSASKDHIGTMMLFGGVEGGVPLLHSLNYYVYYNTADDIHLEPHYFICPGDCPTGYVTLLSGPDKDVAVEHAERDLGIWSTRELFRRFVQRQIDSRRPTVGPPIDVVQLTALGVDESAVKPLCRAESQ
jgi:hypothetical protein